MRRGRVAPPREAHANDDAELELGLSPTWETIPGERRRPGWRRDTILRRSLATADVLAAFVALLVVGRVIAHPPVAMRPVAILLAPFVVLGAKALGLYDRDQHVIRKNTIDEVPALVYCAVLYSMTVWLAQAVLLQGQLERAEVFALTVITFGALCAGRLVTRLLVGSVMGPERCIIVGDGEAAARAVGKLESASGIKAEVVGGLPLGPRGPAQRNGRGFATDRAFVRTILESGADRVIVAPDGHDQDDVLHIIRLIKALELKVSVLPRLLEVVGSSSTFEDIDGMTLLGVRQYGVSKSSEWLKRLMDVIGAALGLVVLSPVLGVLAIAIKVGSRGPVFFRQPRIGRHGERFGMLKFRSMIPHADAIKHELRDRNEVEGGLFKIADDPRITRVGRFLRRTSLDELPQLFNVLGGSMSLVGPRPLVEDEDALIEGWQRRRLAVKPGITGMWQIFGSSRIPMPEMVKIDYLYGANWSIWLDLKILLRTIPYVMRRRGL